MGTLDQTVCGWNKPGNKVREVLERKSTFTGAPAFAYTIPDCSSADLRYCQTSECTGVADRR